MSARRILITAPTAKVVTLNAAKRHLNVEHNDHDAQIEGFVDAVVGAIDPAAGGWLGRALAIQIWEYRLTGFPSCEIRLPYPPLVSVVSVKYDDINGVEQTLPPADYRVFGVGSGDYGEVAPSYGKSWPSARCDRESVRVRYSCGYEAAGEGAEAAAAVPKLIRAWALLEIGKLYANRESVSVVSGGSLAIMPDVDHMLANYRKRGPSDEDTV